MPDRSSSQPAALTRRYDAAAPGWADKMRVLGYRDAYLGFLASDPFRAPDGHRVLDIGCGTGAFAESWVSIHGPGQQLTLLDPSAGMLAAAAGALEARGARRPALAETTLEAFGTEAPFPCLLAAHVIEHVADPVEALMQMRRQTQPGGRLWLVVSKPHWCNAIIWLQWRHRAYAPGKVSQMLQAAGWEMVSEYVFPSGPPSRTSRGYLAKAI